MSKSLHLLFRAPFTSAFFTQASNFRIINAVKILATSYQVRSTRKWGRWATFCLSLSIRQEQRQIPQTIKPQSLKRRKTEQQDRFLDWRHHRVVVIQHQPPNCPTNVRARLCLSGRDLCLLSSLSLFPYFDLSSATCIRKIDWEQYRIHFNKNIIVDGSEMVISWLWDP